MKKKNGIGKEKKEKRGKKDKGREENTDIRGKKSRDPESVVCVPRLVDEECWK